MIVKWVSHLNRQKRRAFAARLLREGLEVNIERGCAPAVACHIEVLSKYLHTAQLAKAEALADLEGGRHFLPIYFATEKAEIEERMHAERVYHSACRNFLTDTLDEQQTEMMLIAGLAPGREDPVEHIVMSWPEGEHPSPEQIEEAADILLNVAGLSEHQAWIVAHGDTKCVHAHIAVNRVHPTTGERVALGYGWGIEALHQAIAVVEYRQGWCPQENALYRADENGVYDRETNVRVLNQRLEPSLDSKAAAEFRRQRKQRHAAITDPSRRYEQRTGLWSLERVAKQDVKPIIDSARDWPDLHARLAEIGVRYERAHDKERAGGRLHFGDRSIAASRAGYDASLSKMERRFGAFVSRGDIAVVEFADREFPKLRAARVRDQAARQKREDKKGIRESRESALAEIKAAQRDAREYIDALGWSGLGDKLNGARATAAIPIREARQAIKDLHHRISGRSTDLHPEWWVDGDEVNEIRRKRPWALLIADRGRSVPVGRHEVPGYETERRGREVHYRRGRALAFVEFENRVEIYRQDDQAVRDALRLATRKWGKVAATGDARFLEQVARLAVEEGIELTNPELRQRMAAIQKRKDEERDQRRREHERLRRDITRLETTQQRLRGQQQANTAPCAQKDRDLQVLKDFDPSLSAWYEADMRADERADNMAADIIGGPLAKQVEELKVQGHDFARRLSQSAARARTTGDGPERKLANGRSPGEAATGEAESREKERIKRAKQWAAAGKDSFASDICAFDHVLTGSKRGWVGPGDGPLARILGDNAVWLADEGVQHRLEAIFWFQEAVRQDIVWSASGPDGARPDPKKKGGSAALPVNDLDDLRRRHADDERLQEQLRLADGKKIKRPLPRNRLFRATLMADKNGAPPAVTEMLALAAIAQPDYLNLKREIPEADEHRIFQSSNNWKRGFHRLPRKNPAMRARQLESAKRRGY